MELEIDHSTARKTVFETVRKYLDSLSFRTTAIDDGRPWGGFFVIDEYQTDNFLHTFFPGLDREKAGQQNQRLSPKILLVEPHKRLSWQYHHRRAELWRIVKGSVGIITSDDDTQGALRSLETSEIIQFDKEVRHRLVGLDNWGVVAEIWQHTDPDNPSEESDIVRVEDDFGR